MKNKAQEALNKLKQKQVIGYNPEGFGMNMPLPIECIKEVKQIQHLIDNQLTVEEIKVMKIWVWEAMANAECSGNDNRAIMYNNLRNKLINQQEMWEVE